MHAEFLALPPEGRQLTEPSLASVPSQSNEAGLCAMLDDNGFSGAPSPRSNPLQQLLGRCVHPASRGWAPTLQTLVSTHECVRLALGTAMLVSATGLHPCIRPTARPPWRWRMRILRAGRHALLQNAAALLLANVEVTKEIVRRLLAGALCDSIAGLAVARHLGCAAARVISPPLGEPPKGMLSASAEIVMAFEHHISSSAGDNVRNSCSKRLMEALSRVFAGPATAAEPQRFDGLNVNAPEDVPGEGIDVAAPSVNTQRSRSSSWIGRSKQRTPPPRAMQLAIDDFVNGFRAQFLPFWMLATACGARPHRLDDVQYDAMHSLNSAVQLCGTLAEDRQLQINRIVLKTPQAALMDVDSVASLLGSPLDTPIGKASLLHFSRTAWLCEQLLVVDLGKRTRMMHFNAICRRHGVEELRTEKEIGQLLPAHAHLLVVCTECSRVANSVVDNQVPSSKASKGAKGGKGCATCNSEPFSEMGVHTVNTLHIPSASGKAIRSIHCSKRSSAALRGAISAERFAAQHSVDADARLRAEAPGEAMEPLMEAVTTMAHDGNVASRMRRDCKRSMEQCRKARLCGDETLLTVSLIGRAVRIFDGWYTLCSFCGVCMRIRPHRRIECEMACLRCGTVQATTSASTEATDPSSSNIPLRCHFCQKPEPLTGHRFVQLPSPLDTYGANRNQEPPLRRTAWCSKHHRPWMRQALQTMTTPQVFAHILVGARPCYDPTDVN